MGANIETGMIEPLAGQQEIDEFKKQFHRRLDEAVPPSRPDERMRRHDEGPPVFRQDETIELRGGRFRVHIVGNMIALEPLVG